MPQSAMQVFLSHATAEKDDVGALRRALEDRGVNAWEDVLQLRLGNGLTKLRDAIRASNAFVLLLSPTSIGSDWVQREVQWALEESAARPDFRLVVLLRGMDPGVLKLLFHAADPVCFCVPSEGPWFEDAAREILKALGLTGTDDHRLQAPEPVPPMAELTLDFSQPKLVTLDDKPRAAGTLRLRYTPPAGRGIDGVPTEFRSPLSPDDVEDLRWYIESYCDWPWGPFKERAKKIEAKLPQWGKMLFDAIVAKQERPMRAFIDAKPASGERLEKRITVNVEYRNADAEGASAAASLFGLPWELLHDEYSFLFDGAAAIRVRRTLPSENEQPPIQPRERVRVLLVRARPEDSGAKFIDPRSSALPLAEVLHDLGESVQLDVLHDGTFKALGDALTKADDNNEPYQIVHFDGHGIYEKSEGIGKLCFEDAEDAHKGLERRQSHKVSAKELGGLLRARRVPLFVLDACQTGMAEKNVDTSVAAELLRQGVGSVVAMRYSVLVGTARRFVRSFYESLAQGHRIGRAMLDAQRALKGNTVRADYGSLGRLELQDWMVPVLFQENADSQIFVRGIDRRPAADEDRKRVDAVRRGELPDAPRHGFVGRARELLSIERRIVRRRCVAIVGAGGEGKTVLAIEMANWFLLTQQRERIAFVSVERLSDARAVLDAIGRQLVPGYSVAIAEAGGNDPMLPVKSALMQRETLLVVDNLESLLALAGKDPTNEEDMRAIVNLVHQLADIGNTWLITTSRESLRQSPDGREWRVPSLSAPDARELLASVLRQHNFEPLRDRKAAEAMETLRDELIEAVRGHARSLVLLGPTIVGQGLEPTRDAIRFEMIELEKRYPDNREKSLLASVRLSLARLDPETRKKIAPLCVFRQAAYIEVMADVLSIDSGEVVELCKKLRTLGLADFDGKILLPDPALATVLAFQIDPAAHADAARRWLEAMPKFAVFLDRLQFENPRVAYALITIALQELMDCVDAMLRGVHARAVSVDSAMKYVSVLEPLVSRIGHRYGSTQIRRLREALIKMEYTWGHTQFNVEMEEVNRQLAANQIQTALELANRLWERANRTKGAYSESEYNLAMAMALRGQALRKAAKPDQALQVLSEARQQFAALIKSSNANTAHNAARMESVVLTDIAVTLFDLGELDEAVATHEEAIRRHQKRGDQRAVMVDREHIALMHLRRRRFKLALGLYDTIKQHYEESGELSALATVWYQVGNVHEEAGNFSVAEDAYRKSLGLRVRLGDKAGEARALEQIGMLYERQRRLDDAVPFYRHATGLYIEGKLVADAWRGQHRLGITFYTMGQLNEAREALKAAISYGMPLDQGVEPWKTWYVLYLVERNAQRSNEAAEARAHALKVYRAYRDAGGQANAGPSALVIAVGSSLEQGSEVAAALLHQVRADNPGELTADKRALLSVLNAVIAGNLDPALANDPELEPTAAVELQLLLESLSAPK